MKIILGLDLGVGSIGWALVNEAENDNEKSSIIKLGVRVNPLTTDESINFEKGKSITTNAERTLKRQMRRNLQRYKLRRENLIEILKKNNIIYDDTILSESGNNTTFETYKLRAKAVSEEISLEEFARILLMINKKRGYKSSRKAKGGEDGKLIDGMDVAIEMYNENKTPGEYCYNLLMKEKKSLPDFYRSDLYNELITIWNKQKEFYPDILNDNILDEIKGKNGSQTWAILAKYFIWTEKYTIWDNDNACSKEMEKECCITAPNRKGNKSEQRIENYKWRCDALTNKMNLEELALVIQNINGEISSSSGYLGAISDRSKELYFKKQTVGEYLYEIIRNNPNESLKNKVFYRQDYLDEFETIWEEQTKYHKELTNELKKEIRDVIIFYQRKLKSQKGLISYCELERDEKVININGKEKTIVIGSKVIPRSSPLFQEFKVWQTINNIRINGDYLCQEEKEHLANILNFKEKIENKDIIQILKLDSNSRINFKEIEGNKTNIHLYKAFSKMLELSGREPLNFKQNPEEIYGQAKNFFEAQGWNTNVLSFDSNCDLDKQPYFKLWHLLFSFEGDNSKTGNEKLIDKIKEICKIEKEYAAILADVTFVEDYGSLSAKAIKKILPFLKEGNQYDIACSYAGYKHSKSSLTKEDIENKILKDKLEILQKNSLRNPVVEKILNQMINVVNTLIERYGKPDEIRVELARELKKNAKERDLMSSAIAKATRENEAIKDKLKKDFNLSHVSKNDIIRYKLYQELAGNKYNTIYSDTHIVYEELLSNKYDIEHIIPKARQFDDSFSNKTLELRDVNIEKGNKTAYDYILEKYGAEGLSNYEQRCKEIFKGKNTKLKNLLMTEKDIPEGFINRDLSDTRYISKMALNMLKSICKRVIATTGSITDKLREDWQLVDIMKELNWDKYKALDLIEYHKTRDGKIIGNIKGWTKRNDHRHHAMDALTVAFTKDVYIQYFNNKNASFEPNSNEYAIKNKYFDSGKAIAPIKLEEFRAEAKKHLENILISIKAKNKVVTNNINNVKVKGKYIPKVQQTPRGSLHKETIYGSQKIYSIKKEKVNASFDREKIMSVASKLYREALLRRLEEFANDPKKAFTGKNSLDKNPIWLSDDKTIYVENPIETVTFETIYTIRKAIDESLKIDKVIDSRIKTILENRLEEFENDPKKAFTNLDENPIWLNKEKGIKIKRVTITGISNAQALHDKRDKDGNLILDNKGNKVPVDFVNTGNNHHVAVYEKPIIDKNGNYKCDEHGNIIYEIDENVVPFYEAVARINAGLPVIDKEYNKENSWRFLFSMKQNEYFVFPNEETGFNPNEIDLLDPDNYSLISPNLFRVQKFSIKDYFFRHHLETKIEDNNNLKEKTWKRIKSPKLLAKIIKVRVNHIGEIVAVGEY
ncbi:MAG: type II CRISPR RNA-guided endonuclease Cas9 [Bacteroidales bacterium]|nr:type II CRISPR RNA-guided endonuclease Cas9 [Bacteroidales bacterium]